MKGEGIITTPEARAIKGNKNRKENKILPPKQLLQRLPILLALVEAGKTSGNLNRLGRLFTHCIRQNKFQKLYNSLLKSEKR